MKLFVWGTLKKREPNHWLMRVAKGKFLKTAYYKGFPPGEIYEVPEIGISFLDGFEIAFGYKRITLGDGVQVYRGPFGPHRRSNDFDSEGSTESLGEGKRVAPKRRTTGGRVQKD